MPNCSPKGHRLHLRSRARSPGKSVGALRSRRSSTSGTWCSPRIATSGTTTRRRPSTSTKRWPDTRTEGWPRSFCLRERSVPATALQHCEEDIARARAILAHADPLPRTNATDQLLRSDLLRSAWMFAVGAMDAYFCDAYTDIVAATINSKSRQNSMTLPDWLYEIRFPIAAIVEEYAYSNWRWRMAARKMMERENVLSLETIRKLFNKFFRKGHRFFGDLLD